ncbi:MAG: serine/threonine-protein kinase, partial [Polyangiales bacterium]
MSTSQPLPPQAPIVGGKYRLGAVIGSGGVGTVYRATHLWTEREVAVKVLDSSLPHFDQLRDAFLMEARATVQLQHPNVVEVLDMGEDDTGIPYMVMELLDGPTLRDVLVEQGRLSPEDTANILVPMIDALQKAHELGIVHKDFKPENIILSIDASEFMTPKLLDFGVAQLLRDAHPRGLEAPDEVIVGTPQYMSPEQARDERDLIGPQTDVWGVGVVWYECLTGRSPFDRET